MTDEYSVDTSSMHVEGRGTSPTSASDAEAQAATSTGFNLSVPTSVTQGSDLTITGEIYPDCTITVFSIPTRVRVEIPEIGASETIKTGRLSCGNTSQFETTFNVQSEPETVLTVEITGLVDGTGPFTGWQSTGTRQETVEVVSESQDNVNTVFDYAPWLMAGGGAGYLVSTQADVDPATAAVAGAGTAAILKRSGGKTLLPDFSLPTGGIAVIGGSALALYLLTQSTGASEVLNAAGGAAGRGIRSVSGRQ